MDLKSKKKIVKVIGNAEIALEKLERNIKDFETHNKTPPKSDKQLLKSIYHALNLLKVNPFEGDPVAHKLWPPDYEKFPNLFRMELSQFWRMLYYVTGDEVRIISVVFEISDHKKYNKIFGYKKK